MYNKTIKKGVDTMHRTIIYTSFLFDADFLAYYKGKKLVALCVEGSAVSVKGKVDEQTFCDELKEIYRREKRTEERFFNFTFSDIETEITETILYRSETETSMGMAMAHQKLHKIAKRF